MKQGFPEKPLEQKPEQRNKGAKQFRSVNGGMLCSATSPSYFHINVSSLLLTHVTLCVCSYVTSRTIFNDICNYIVSLDLAILEKGSLNPYRLREVDRHMTIASMRGVVKRYGSYVALDCIDFDIYEGEIIGLLGPNGAGKTTLIHALTGLTPVDHGTVSLFGQAKQPFSRQNKERLGLVTQDITIFDELTAKQNLLFFAGVYGLKGKEKQERVKEALDFVGLGDKGDKNPAKFSGGMKRRLNIACALAHRPKLLIMDEPTVGIDPQSRNHILEAVKKLRDNGTTILYTSHYMEEVQAIASRVIIMDQGQMIKEGTVEQLIETIQSEEKVRIDVTEPYLVPVNQLEAIAGVKQVAVAGNQISVISAAGSGNLDRILTIVKERTGVVGIQADKPNLEDVFFTLTGKQLRDRGERE